MLKSYFVDYDPIVHQVIDNSDDVYSAELLDINPKNRTGLKWFRKNNLLIGDAIHPTTPNMANGACLAMEDSYLLASLLGDNKLTVQQTIEIFQERRTKKLTRWFFNHGGSDNYCIKKIRPLTV